MQRLLTLTTLWIGFLAAACSASPDESLSGTHQALNKGSGATGITTDAQCIMGCVSAVDHCEKHQRSELNCPEKGEECLEACDAAFPSARASDDGIATSPSVSALASDDGIATSPGVSVLAFNIGFGGGGISSGPGYQQCIPTQTCDFVCDPPQGPNDIFHCKLQCTYFC